MISLTRKSNISPLSFTIKSIKHAQPKDTYFHRYLYVSIQFYYEDSLKPEEERKSGATSKLHERLTSCFASRNAIQKKTSQATVSQGDARVKPALLMRETSEERARYHAPHSF